MLDGEGGTRDADGTAVADAVAVAVAVEVEVAVEVAVVIDEAANVAVAVVAVLAVAFALALAVAFALVAVTFKEAALDAGVEVGEGDSVAFAEGDSVAFPEVAFAVEEAWSARGAPVPPPTSSRSRRPCAVVLEALCVADGEPVAEPDAEPDADPEADPEGESELKGLDMLERVDVGLMGDGDGDGLTGETDTVGETEAVSESDGVIDALNEREAVTETLREIVGVAEDDAEACRRRLAALKGARARTRGVSYERRVAEGAEVTP